MRHVQIDRQFYFRRSVPHLGASAPSWLGETIGFWDRDTLIDEICLENERSLQPMK